MRAFYSYEANERRNTNSFRVSRLVDLKLINFWLKEKLAIFVWSVEEVVGWRNTFIWNIETPVGMYRAGRFNDHFTEGFSSSIVAFHCRVED